MLGEIIAIGDELTSGRILNTTSGYAARTLFAAGHELYAMHTIGDDPPLIGEALRRAIGRVEFVIVTGGLGSTSDDLTNEAVAAALDRPTAPNPDFLASLRECAGERSRDLEKLAWLPQGAEALNPGARMAGHLLVHDGVPVFFLPGVPAQMRRLMHEEVLPRLAAWDRHHARPMLQRVFRLFGLAETEVNRRLADLEGRDGCRMGYYPVDGEVHVSLSMRGGPGAAERFAALEEEVRQRLGAYVYGKDRQTLAAAMGAALASAGLTLAVAESCTGGLIGGEITAVPGSSAWFRGGIIAYANRVKEDLLAVPGDMLAAHGAVSAPVARAMAAGARRAAGSALAVAVTGIAGPGGGSAEKPVGTVHIALASTQGTKSREHHFQGDRATVRRLAMLTALDMVRRRVQGTGEQEAGDREQEAGDREQETGGKGQGDG